MFNRNKINDLAKLHCSRAGFWDCSHNLLACKSFLISAEFALSGKPSNCKQRNYSLQTPAGRAGLRRGRGNRNLSLVVPWCLPVGGGTSSFILLQLANSSSRILCPSDLVVCLPQISPVLSRDPVVAWESIWCSTGIQKLEKHFVLLILQSQGKGNLFSVPHLF